MRKYYSLSSKRIKSVNIQKKKKRKMQKFIIIILQSEIRCNNWDVSTVKNITNVSSYPIYTFKMAEEYRSFPPLFVLHSEKLWTVDVSNDTRRFEADIEASSLSATWPRIEKTYNIF